MSIPRGPELPQLITQLNTIASLSGMAITVLGFTVTENIGEQQKAPGAMPIEISLTVEGTYGALKSFLDAAERNRRLLDVIGVNLDGFNAEGRADLILLLKAYYHP